MEPSHEGPLVVDPDTPLEVGAAGAGAAAQLAVERIPRREILSQLQLDVAAETTHVAVAGVGVATVARRLAAAARCHHGGIVAVAGAAGCGDDVGRIAVSGLPAERVVAHPQASHLAADDRVDVRVAIRAEQDPVCRDAVLAGDESRHSRRDCRDVGERGCGD